MSYTQVQRNGLFELSDAARTELMSSKYYNDDLAPSSVAERTWGKDKHRTVLYR